MDKRDLNKTLQRQIKKVGIDPSSLDPAIENLLMMVDDTYKLHKREMTLLNRAMNLSADELSAKNVDLNQAVSLSKDFSQIVAHNLKEPIRTIVSFTELVIKKSDNLNAKTLQYLDLIAKAGFRIDTYLTDLMSFLVLGKHEYENEKKVKIELGTVVDRCCSNLNLLITENEAKILHKNLPNLNAFPSHFDQLFINLITNAIKFKSDRTPEIMITAENLGYRYRIAFTDNGIGIKPKFQDQIFGAFKRLDRDIAGSGMGLAICKRIVQLYDGHIDVESIYGSGTTINIYLPQKLIKVDCKISCFHSARKK